MNDNLVYMRPVIAALVKSKGHAGTNKRDRGCFDRSANFQTGWLYVRTKEKRSHLFHLVLLAGSLLAPVTHLLN